MAVDLIDYALRFKLGDDMPMATKNDICLIHKFVFIFIIIIIIYPLSTSRRKNKKKKNVNSNKTIVDFEFKDYFYW